MPQANLARSEGLASHADVLRAWTAQSLSENPGWQLAAPAGIEQDFAVLRAFLARYPDAEARLTRDEPALATPPVIARSLKETGLDPLGVALLTQVPAAEPEVLRLYYLALGLQWGQTIDTYGRLYDVCDVGANYREQAVPVSMTKETTGMHTDSSARSVCPDLLGLLCIRQAPKGGDSRIVSVERVHGVLMRQAPALLARLYRPFIRDVVTPNAKRDVDTIIQNAFPVFFWRDGLRLRYMRYWIERGHDNCGVPLTEADLAAFDALDKALNAPENAYGFRMAPGDMLFIDNTTIAHDRDGFEDDPAAPRLMVRLWLNRQD
jgi:Taurine catabolism dioxygenase TauD, TfdA family